MDCLDALSRLDYPRDHFEVILVDDQGQIPAEATAAPFKKKLDLLVLRQDWGGPAVARNTGAAHAKGTYLCFTDSDCLPDPGWLRCLEARFRDEPEVAVGGRTLNGLPDNTCSVASQVILDAVHSFFNERAGKPMFFAPTNLAVPAHLFLRCGGFDPRFTVSEDRDFCERWQRRGGRFCYAREAIVYHTHPLGLWDFFRRHLNYGRGARRFHLTRNICNGRGEFADLLFYPFLFGYTFRKGLGPRTPAVALFVMMARIIYIIGYLVERLPYDPPSEEGRVSTEKEQ
jgi:cellulose synthase/poly-beta-1,6-N-acetylglucosamine synthase-like glycosyltransferase